MDERRQRGLKAAAVDPIRSEDWPTNALRPLNSVLDCGKFRHDFGFELPDWRSSLADVVARLAARA
jgi:dTDP-4-dehydrorhamnose reductase